jgi:hypothetical protein
MGFAKWGFVAFLLFWVGLALFGLWQKLRDGEVAWKFNNFVSRRNGPDQFGYWLSVSFNFVLVIAATALALAVAFDFVPTTWGRS